MKPPMTGRGARTGARAAILGIAITALTAGSLASAAQASPGQSVTTLRDTTAISLASDVDRPQRHGPGRVLHRCGRPGRALRRRRLRRLPDDGRGADVGLADRLRPRIRRRRGLHEVRDPRPEHLAHHDRRSRRSGDVPLTDLVGATTYDAATLTIEVVPQGRRLLLTYVLGSEEYATWAQTGYGDAFAVWVDGTPCSFVPAPTRSSGRRPSTPRSTARTTWRTSRRTTPAQSARTRR